METRTGTTTILTNLICQYAEKTVVEEMSEKLARPTRQHSPVVEELQLEDLHSLEDQP